MRRSFRAPIIAGICLAIAAIAAPAFAGPGDLDTTFSGDGVKTVDYVGSSDTFYGVAVHGNAPTTCGISASEATLTAFTAGGAFNMSFSGDGKWRQNILGHGYSYLEACRFLRDGRLVAVGGAQGADGNDRIDRGRSPSEREARHELLRRRAGGHPILRHRELGCLRPRDPVERQDRRSRRGIRRLGLPCEGLLRGRALASQRSTRQDVQRRRARQGQFRRQRRRHLEGARRPRRDDRAGRLDPGTRPTPSGTPPSRN